MKKGLCLFLKRTCSLLGFLEYIFQPPRTKLHDMNPPSTTHRDPHLQQSLSSENSLNQTTLPSGCFAAAAKKKNMKKKKTGGITAAAFKPKKKKKKKSRPNNLLTLDVSVVLMDHSSSMASSRSSTSTLSHTMSTTHTTTNTSSSNNDTNANASNCSSSNTNTRMSLGRSAFNHARESTPILTGPLGGLRRTQSTNSRHHRIRYNSASAHHPTLIDGTCLERSSSTTTSTSTSITGLGLGFKVSVLKI